MSAKFETYKEKYEKGWMTKETLKQWVAMYSRLPALGITEDEYKQITGEEYE